MEREELTRSKFTNATAVPVLETFNEILTRCSCSVLSRA